MTDVLPDCPPPAVASESARVTGQQIALARTSVPVERVDTGVSNDSGLEPPGGLGLADGSHPQTCGDPGDDVSIGARNHRFARGRGAAQADWNRRGEGASCGHPGR
jgi:hypothetical protein